MTREIMENNQRKNKIKAEQQLGKQKIDKYLNSKKGGVKEDQHVKTEQEKKLIL